VRLIEGTQASATAVKSMPTKVLTFKPAPTKTIKTEGQCQGTEKTGYTCLTTNKPENMKRKQDAGAPTFLGWCHREGKAFSCFVSPFDHVQYLVSSSSEPSDRGHVKMPWGLVLKSGEHCVDESGGGYWKCDKRTALAAVLPSGDNWVALSGEDVLAVPAIYLR
jgi:hypothetical protein